LFDALCGYFRYLLKFYSIKKSFTEYPRAFGYYYLATIGDITNKKFIYYGLNNFCLLHPDSWTSIVRGTWSRENAAGNLDCNPTGVKRGSDSCASKKQIERATLFNQVDLRSSGQTKMENAAVYLARSILTDRRRAIQLQLPP
jgi:hypothetical protein